MSLKQNDAIPFTMEISFSLLYELMHSNNLPWGQRSDGSFHSIHRADEERLQTHAHFGRWWVFVCGRFLLIGRGCYLELLDSSCTSKTDTVFITWTLQILQRWQKMPTKSTRTHTHTCGWELSYSRDIYIDHFWFTFIYFKRQRRTHTQFSACFFLLFFFVRIIRDENCAITCTKSGRTCPGFNFLSGHRNKMQPRVGAF